MGGFFGVSGRREVISDVYFGTDYHSHLGTKSGGMAAYDSNIGFQREIHSISDTPFRSKFASSLRDMRGRCAIGTINDSGPQPLLVRSALGIYAICMVGIINNSDKLIENYLASSGDHFDVMTGGVVNTTELVAALINQKHSFVEGIRYAQDCIEGTAAILILTEKGTLIVARDKMGRLPILVGKGEDAYCVAFESFAYEKLDYETCYELGSGEIIEISPEGYTVLAPAHPFKKVCAFLWTYYGYPTSTYEGVNVEQMRNRNGAILARNDMANGTFPEELDYVGGVPDSGTPHAIGYSNGSKMPFARPFIKYTQTWLRSFMPTEQNDRHLVAKMKQIPVKELIKDKDLLFVDDSIVRGTQLKETVDFLYDNGAKSVHMRSACPPVMYACKYLNFSRGNGDMDLLARNIIFELEGEEGSKHVEEYSDPLTERGKALRKAICEKMHFSSLEYQTVAGIEESIGLPKDSICTYCWNGKE